MNKNQKQQPNSKTNMDRVDNDNIFDKWLMALIYVALLLLRKKKMMTPKDGISKDKNNKNTIKNGLKEC